MLQVQEKHEREKKELETSYNTKVLNNDRHKHCTVHTDWENPFIFCVYMYVCMYVCVYV